MSVGQGDGFDLAAWQEGVAHAAVALSEAVLGFGVALAGIDAMRVALDVFSEDSPLTGLLDGDGGEDDEGDAPGDGVNEDLRRDPEPGEWVCPVGEAAPDCKRLHDHFPPPPPASAGRRPQ